MRSLLLSLSVAFVVLSWSSIASADEGCVTSDCHSVMGTQKYVHGPVGARICTVCHVETDKKDHKFKLSVEKDELCFGCHDGSRDMMLQEHLHTPAAEGNCVGCHDPHQSNYKFSLKGQAADLCFNCHDRSAFTDEYVHGPVAAGDCNVCHDPHASAFENQLMSPKEDICMTCHEEKREKMNSRHVHQPVEEDCTNCHNPHAEKSKYMLPASTPDLCFGCHSDILEASTSTHKHDPVAAGRCGECHDSHASDYPRLFPKAQFDLCLSCHEDLAEYVNSQEHLHGPIKDGDCNACHQPHGSEYSHILRHYFPDEFYTPYSTENYAICFECHNKDVALDSTTKTLTDFRNNDINLHYTHVHKDVKGRSCKACHEPHASNQGKHVRESVPFGSSGWELPINYTKSDDGGSCVVGCHAPKSYSRK